jgi:hypothetical protein
MNNMCIAHQCVLPALSCTHTHTHTLHKPDHLSLLLLSGPYLDDPKVAAKFSTAYMEMTGGFLTFPLKFPGTAVWRAMKASTMTDPGNNSSSRAVCRRPVCTLRLCGCCCCCCCCSLPCHVSGLQPDAV